jgi:hypothetical protein
VGQSVSEQVVMDRLREMLTERLIRVWGRGIRRFKRSFMFKSERSRR